MTEAGPVQLAGMRKVGSSADGDAVEFTLEAQSGKEFRFSCPHEALPEIIENLTALADMAWKQRGSPDETDVAPGTKGTARYKTVTGMRIDAAPDGIVLSLLCEGLKHQVLLSPDKCIQLAEILGQAPEARKTFFRPH